MPEVTRGWRARIVDALEKRGMDSLETRDPRMVIIGFVTPEDAREFYDAMNRFPPGTSDGGGE